ncbi:MAG TPA: hypothetical protein VGK74_22235 [Symbiobacteriaceae bacterium]
MATAKNFPATSPLYDVTVPALAPLSSGVTTPVTGAVGAPGQPTYCFVTPNVLQNNSGALVGGVVGEVLMVEVTSPVVQAADGSIVYPDLGWWFVPDGTDLQKYQNLDGSYGSNMMPSREVCVGREQLKFGISLRRLLTEARNGHPRSNMALLATGIKFVSNLALKLASARGWGIAGDVVKSPARIRVWGERYSQDTLAALAGFYDGSFSRQSLRRELDGLPPITGWQGGAATMDMWTGLPGGYNQRGTIVHRYFNFASNLAQTAAQTPYILSNVQNIGGAQGNVALNNDLGYGFGPTQGTAAQAKDALVIQQFGVVPGIANIAWAGFQVGGSNVPEPNGFPVGAGADRWAYGQVSPLRQGSELYFPLPDYEGELEIYQENAAVQVTAGGTAIAANAAVVAIGGVRITLA